MSRFLAALCLASTVSWTTPAYPFPPVQQAAPVTTPEPPKRIPNEQLDALVAPIAFFPDPLLAQTLAASTYPLEVVQLHQWLQKNEDLKGKQLDDAIAAQSWDPSVRQIAGRPDLVKHLADDVQWTTDLGNAFLAQQADVNDAVQRVRLKAKDSGNLKSDDHIKVKTNKVDGKKVIVVEER